MKHYLVFALIAVVAQFRGKFATTTPTFATNTTRATSQAPQITAQTTYKATYLECYLCQTNSIVPWAVPPCTEGENGKKEVCKDTQFGPDGPYCLTSIMNGTAMYRGCGYSDNPDHKLGCYKRDDVLTTCLCNGCGH